MLEFNYKDNQIQYSHDRSGIINIGFHVHDGYEIYFLISGDVNYFVENKVYPLKYGDLIITNNNEVHKPSFLSSTMYERIFVQFGPNIPGLFSSTEFDLLSCFNNRNKGEKNKIALTKMQIEEVMKIFGKIENLEKSPRNGFEILKMVYFIELLVFINRVFSNSNYVDEPGSIPLKLAPIFEYIDANLESDLTLHSMEKKFFINRFYLSRLFKKNTGMNIHEYILYKRILLAKSLLAGGYNVTEVCQISGFSDYSNFIRTFKRIVGVSPGKYKKSV